MSAIKLRLLTAGPHVVNDMGLTLQGGVDSIIDLVDARSEDISTSNDLITLIDAGDIIVLDPRDPQELINLSADASRSVLVNHNRVQWGVIGGRFGALDDPNITLTENHIVTIGPNGGVAIAQPLSTVLADTDNTLVVNNIVADMFNTESDITYDPVTATFDLEDNFLRNTGDVLESGDLLVSTNASITIDSGGKLNILGVPTVGSDAANKAYVDSVASGLDAKESVRLASTGDIGFAYLNNGGIGDTLTSTLTNSTTVIDGEILEDGDRVLIKDQLDPLQNGIYTVSSADSASTTVLTRAEDQDSSPANEVSAGNFTYVEVGNINASTGWVVQGDGILTVNTDNIVWTQFSGAGSYTGGVGITQNGTSFSLTTTNIPIVPSVSGDDVIIIGDNSGNGATAATTISSIISDLDIPHGINSTGIVVRTANDVYTSREFAAQPSGPLGGLVIENSDGVDGNPTVGLDIQNAIPRDSVELTDTVLVYDASSGQNRTYTIEDIADSTSADSFSSWASAGNVTGDGKITASGGDDEITITGGAGVNIDLNATTQNITFSITGNTLPVATSVAGIGEIIVLNPTTGVPEKVTLDTVVDSLDLVTSVSASVVAGLEGITIDSTDPADPMVGINIDDLSDRSGNKLTGTDQLIAYNGTNNVSVTGAQIAEGVVDYIGIPRTSASVVNGQHVITSPDPTRNDKELSTDSVSFMWSENQLGANDWIQIGGASDGDSGYIMPLDGTITMVTAHCENALEPSTINIFNGTSTSAIATAGSFAVSPNAQFVNTTLDNDFSQGDRIRLRNVGGRINDTVVTMFVKWRA